MRQARLPTGIDCRTRIGRRPGQAAPSWMTAGVARAATWDRSGSFRPFGGIEVRGYLRINLVTGETVSGVVLTWRNGGAVAAASRRIMVILLRSGRRNDGRT